jgi:hypothetical protein
LKRALRSFWQFVLPLATAIAAARWVTIAQWASYRPDLLLLLGIYAAALIQVAVTSANLTLPNFLDVEEARQLAKQLTTQQQYWIGLFVAIIAAVISLLLVTYLASPISAWPVVEAGSSFWLGLLTAYCICQTINFVSGLLSLQRLRSHYLVVEAERRAAEKATIISAGQVGEPPFRAPEGYGDVLRPH